MPSVTTLLLDALDRALLEPQCARRWHGLMATWLETPDPAARRQVLDTLQSLPDGDSRADILRLTFLAQASGNPQFENDACARVLALRPADPDRLASFMAYQWLSALQHLEGRAQFVAALSAGRVPEMALRQMQSATETLPPDFPARTPDEIRRVAVVVPYVGNQFHTPSVMAVEQCAVLAREGLQVQLFSAQELLPPDASQFRGDGRELALPPLNAQAWAKFLPAGVSMTVSDSRFSLPGRWRKLMPVLAGFDADVVLLVGLYSPLAAALHTVRPVAGLSVNTVPPIAPADVWLTADTAPERRDVWGESFAPPQPVYHPWRVKRSRKQWPVTRAELGLGAAAVVWVTAGFRLAHEIKPEWADRMLHLMSRHPDVVWLVIGGEGKLPQALQQAAPGRVRALATRSDLSGILRICDIYVNPPRMGGGLSVAEAMAESLPVVSRAGSDGGDKAGELALPDMATYMERLAALTENPALRAETGQALRRRFDEHFDLDASGPALLAACRQAAELASARLTKPS
jgi:hypothetical protein